MLTDFQNSFTDRLGSKFLVKAKFHYAIQLAKQLASWLQTCSRPGRDLDSVMEFGNSITLSSSRPSSRTGSWACLRPALAKFH